MSTLATIGTAFSRWIGTVADALRRSAERFARRRRVEIVEEAEEGRFTMRVAAAKAGVGPGELRHLRLEEWSADRTLPPDWVAALRGSRVELTLRPDRFLVRPLVLPKKAAEFLDGIVKSQIDRLTPWSAHDAVYHWGAPEELTGERIAVNVVATARSRVVPLVQAVADQGAAVVTVATDGPTAAKVVVHTHRAAGAGRSRRLENALAAVFLLSGGAALLSLLVAGFLADQYDAEKQQILQRLAERRAVLQPRRAGTGTAPLDLLERRKHATASSVMIIEALSALLPDHTYATELRIEGDKLQLVGLSKDAPALIQILEQSPHFGRVSFYAPTTRAPNDPGERFHIEARIKPHFGPRT